MVVQDLGREANPKGTWQIDSFGHTNTQAWLLGAEAGMTSLFWGRMDYQDREMRYGRKQSIKPPTGGFEWVWRGSKVVGFARTSSRGICTARGRAATVRG